MSPAVILGIESATPSGGIALADEAGNLLLHRWSLSRTGFSRRLMPMIDAALAELSITREGLSAIAVTSGPGSFTGVRVGIVTAKTLAHALGIPLYLFSTLECAARRVPEALSGPICMTLDARRGELYWGLYDRPNGSGLQSMIPEAVSPPSRLLDELEATSASEIWLSGEASLGRRKEFEARLGSRARFVASPWNVPAADLVAIEGARALAAGIAGSDPLLAVPTYIRASDAERGLALRGGAAT